MAKKPKLGSGARFKQLKGKLAAKGATNPGALAAYIGRKKYGKAKFQKLSSKGKKRMEPEKGESKAHEKAESKAFEKKEHEGGKMGRKKRSASVPAGSRNPFGSLKTDKLGGGAGSTMYPNMLSKTSKQNQRDTGKSLLQKAMKRLAKKK